nr:hypothetical protein [Myxococcota bacterium]
WAHFISTATFNYRGQSVNKFVYYQPIKYSSTYTKQDPAPVDPAYRRRWNETKCWVSGTNHTGVEWDWLTFFYRLWNSGTYRLDVDEIRDIWPRDGSSDSDYYWTAILNSALGKLSTEEYSNFFNEGLACGVDH